MSNKYTLKYRFWRFVAIHQAEILCFIMWATLLITGNIANIWLSAVPSISIGVTCAFVAVISAAYFDPYKYWDRS